MAIRHRARGRDMIHKPCRESTYTNCPAPKNCPPLALLPLMPPPSLQRFVYFINKKEVNILFSMSSESRCWWSKWYIHTIVLLFQKPGFYSLAACRVVLHCHHQWGHCIILSLIIVCLIKDFNTLLYYTATADHPWSLGVHLR